jgi:hypothetical protein
MSSNLNDSNSSISELVILSSDTVSSRGLRRKRPTTNRENTTAIETNSQLIVDNGILILFI